ncbi:MAG: DNA topoisomerase I [candidate division KSB1 bacterium]|nr:DNA topoisomerase I [candidate division KSB1 bacterium]
MLKQLHHVGILVPEPPEYQGLSIRVDGEKIKLDPRQEEMAYAWAKKLGTPYVEDRVFVKNFIKDFSDCLGYDKPLSIDQIDFSEVIERVRREKEARDAMTKEEKKKLAAKRKEIREALKEEYGHAEADGERIELANYMTEPSGIFMGRGKHPMRGRWKEGAKKKDVTLNLSPDAESIDPDEWKEIIWQPESLWVARWQDKLSGKFKYIWLHDSAPIKQEREAGKFDKAIELSARLQEIRSRIESALVDEHAKRRRIATACYLIDYLCLRVGDEKDPDEADTVGATTLRPEHITFHDDGLVEFRFLGKDSILWNKKLELPQVVRDNLQELVDHARPSNSSMRMGKSHPNYKKPQLFYDISSRNVNEFLSEIMTGLSAKVFRTLHATRVVKDTLVEADVKASDPQYKKWEAANKANAEAAILCNHNKKPPKNWKERQQRYKEREAKTREQIQKIKDLKKEIKDQLRDLKKEGDEKRKAAKKNDQKAKYRDRYEKRIEKKRKSYGTHRDPAGKSLHPSIGQDQGAETHCV